MERFDRSVTLAALVDCFNCHETANLIAKGVRGGV